MKTEEIGKWIIEGNFVYQLQETGRYIKGEPILENKFCFSVSGAASLEDRGKIAEYIASLLNGTKQ